jgi:hypothetical protein
VFEHTVRVIFANPSVQCPPPWQVLAFPPIRNYSADANWASARTGVSRMGFPYVANIESDEVQWAWAPSRARSIPIGLYIPCLRTDGWWSLEVPPQSGVAAPVTARFCAWGTLTPNDGAPSISTTVLAVPGAHHGWDLTIRVNLSSFRPLAE